MKFLLLASLLLALAPTGCNVQTVGAPTAGAPAAAEPRATRPATQATKASQAAIASQTAAAPQPFDFYLLNLSWAPEFCASHPNVTNYAECSQHLRFILHGLWPQTISPPSGPPAPFLQNCSTQKGPANPGQYADIYPEPGLLQHEWATHGTCSGLAPDAYFALARTAVKSVAIPATLLQLDHQISLPPNEILDQFRTANPAFPADSFALTCGNNYLTAIEVCLAKSGQPTPCGPIKSCRAQTVRIPPP